MRRGASHGFEDRELAAVGQPKAFPLDEVAVVVDRQPRIVTVHSQVGPVLPLQQVRLRLQPACDLHIATTTG